MSCRLQRAATSIWQSVGDKAVSTFVFFHILFVEGSSSKLSGFYQLRGVARTADTSSWQQRQFICWGSHFLRQGLHVQQQREFLTPHSRASLSTNCLACQIHPRQLLKCAVCRLPSLRGGWAGILQMARVFSSPRTFSPLTLRHCCWPPRQFDFSQWPRTTPSNRFSGRRSLFWQTRPLTMTQKIHSGCGSSLNVVTSRLVCWQRDFW